MDFLAWHYSRGLHLYLRRWIFSIGWVIHFFSLPILIISLFAPWKRLIDDDNTPGFNLERAFQQISFNIISRCIGAVVRIFLIIFCLILLIPAIVLGIIGLLFWLFIPFIGLPYYFLHDAGQRRFLFSLSEKLKSHPLEIIKTAFDNRPGRFVLSHTQLRLSDLDSIADISKVKLNFFSPTSYTHLVKHLIEAHVWQDDQTKKLGVTFEDLILAAQWWDSLYSEVDDLKDKKLRYSRPGIGLELLFGYTPQLNKYVTDLSLNQPFSHHLIGREDIVSRIERNLTSGKCVILTGIPGVGKKTVVLEFARRCMSGELSSKMLYKRVLEFDFNFLLSESLDINKKKALLSQLLREAVNAGNIILVIKDLHRLTHSDIEGLDFTDLFEQFLEKRQLKIIAISSQTDYERFLATNARLRKFFEPVEVVAPPRQDALNILVNSANTWESQKHLIFTTQALRAIIDDCDKYVTDTPFPEKALEILDDVVSLSERQDKTVITIDTVNTVITEHTGISLAHLTQSEKTLLGNLEDVLHQRLIGQTQAVSLIAKSLRARSVGAKDESRPIGSFLFLGPTGVGKTETAKALAQIYYGSEKNILRFDMAEYIGEEGLTRLIGSLARNQPGILTNAIHNHPASLLLLDEIEKAPPSVYNLFLSLLDEGSITDAFGKKIICRHLFVIATSNAGAEEIRQLVASKTPPKQLQNQVVDYIQKNHIFSPEFLNRFDGVVVFEPLAPDQLEQIAQNMLKSLQNNLSEKNIRLEIDPAVFKKVAQDGFQPEFGARPMRRIVDIVIGDVLGKAILTNKLKEGDKVKLIVDDSESGYSLLY
jgi:ATP-dependent Clp protease ATP-binding subunit ClpC